MLASDVQRKLKKTIKRLTIAVIILSLLLIGSNAFWAHKCSKANAMLTNQKKITVCQVRTTRQYARKKTA